MSVPTKPAAKQALFNERGLLDANIPDEAAIQTAMLRAPDQSFAQWMEGRVARYATRRYDWDALKFQADYDPKYRRAQMRYMGTGGTGIAADSNIGDEDPLMCVMLGSPQPITPVYPPDSPLAKIKRNMTTNTIK